jgi:diguanylate cyclase (GGDEF)-like protein/PAS domain S-box-containing protein
VACDAFYPPYSFLDARGQLVGIGPDLWREWSRITGTPVRLIPLPWSEALEAVRTGTADVLENAFRTPDRERIFAFTRPYAEVSASIFFDRHLRGITSDPRSLEGFAVGAVTGDYAETYLYSRGILSVRSYPTFEEVVRAFGRGEIKVFLMDEPAAYYYLYREDLQGNVRVSAPLYRGELHRAIRLDRAELILPIQAGFDAISPGVAKAIFARWEGELHHALPPHIFPSLIALAAAAAVAAILLFAWNRALRRRVATATEEIRKTMEELSESRARYERVLRGTNDAIFEVDPATETFYGSPRWEEILGAPLPETGSYAERLERFILPEDREKLATAIDDLAAERVEYLIVEYRVRRPDGEVRWIRSRGSAVRDQEGKILRISGASTDITSLKAEEAARELLYEIAEIALSSKDLEGLFRRLHEALRRHLPAKNLYVALYDPGSKTLSFPYFADEMEPDPPSPRVAGRGLTEYVLRTGRPFLAHEIDLEPLFASGEVESMGAESLDWLGVPLLLEGEPRGVLAVQSYDPEVLYGPEDERVLAFASGQIALAVERKLTEERLAWNSFHDSVTGLYNRAFFEEELNRLDVPRNLPLSILMGDVNGLKLVNDGFGHMTGDLLLQRTAEAICRSCREDDVVARWGGDEFAVLLPRTEKSVAHGVVRRIREAVSQVSDLPVRPGIALGAATKEASEESATEILREAEERMYRSKTLDEDRSRSALLESLQETLWTRAPRLRAHAERVRSLSERIGRAMELPPEEVRAIGRAALLHDIGKASLPDDLLGSAPEGEGPEASEQREALERHSEIGYRIARASSEFASSAEVILAHHEQWDGRGYPKRLSGDRIPLAARILAVANRYDGLLHPPRGEGLPPEEAMRRIRSEAGRAFDPAVVAAFGKLASADE